MTIKQIFDLAIKTGIENDPRGKLGVAEFLRNNKKEYQELPAAKKAEFDREKLSNPYSDSRILFGDIGKKIKRVLVGIDIDTDEILLANELGKQGKKIDLIIAHHPLGKALARLHEVMDIQTAVLAISGVPENIGEGVLKERLEQVWRQISPINHYKPVMAAKILNIPIICVHTPADNCVWKFVDDYIKKIQPKNLAEILDSLKKIPEYKKAVEMNTGPSIFAGDEKNRAGKIVVAGMTGGTSGSAKIYERMSHFGIGTEIAMHIREEDREEAVKHYINIVIAGHMTSDSLGLNLILDKIAKKGIEIIPCSGYIRISRNKR